MPKVGCSAKAFSNEATFLSNLKSCEGVIQLINAAMDTHNYYLVTEWASSGDLLSQIMESKEKRFSERLARDIISSLLKTLHFLHSAGVVHRDLKPENVVFVKEKPTIPKLIDFADAVLLESLDSVHKDLCGTVFYLAPERFRTHFGWELLQSEMWTVGIFVFEMVFGKRAFYGLDDEAVLEKIAAVDYHIPRSIASTPECRHFIRHCLVFDPKKRMTPMMALKHPWITGRTSSKSGGGSGAKRKSSRARLSAKSIFSSSSPRGADKDKGSGSPKKKRGGSKRRSGADDDGDAEHEPVPSEYTPPSRSSGRSRTKVIRKLMGHSD